MNAIHNRNSTHFLTLLFSNNLTVNRVRFSPKILNEKSDSVELKIASCGADNSVKIFDVFIKKVIV
jgi:hypothetical protein